MNVRTLRANARASAEARGHQLMRFQRLTDGRYSAVCRAWDCSGWVHVDPHPPANGIDIGGTAVAINCPCVETP